MNEHKWQTIDTAPPEIDLLVWSDVTQEQFVVFQREGRFWLIKTATVSVAMEDLTHWRYLPSPPEEPISVPYTSRETNLISRMRELENTIQEKYRAAVKKCNAKDSKKARTETYEFNIVENTYGEKFAYGILVEHIIKFECEYIFPQRKYDSYSGYIGYHDCMEDYYESEIRKLEKNIEEGEKNGWLYSPRGLIKMQLVDGSYKYALTTSLEGVEKVCARINELFVARQSGKYVPEDIT